MKKIKQFQTWEAGDCFAIPLVDGGSLLGQILAAEPTVLNSVSCALFDQDGMMNALPDPYRLFSTVMTTRDMLDSGKWKIVGNSSINIDRLQFPFESFRDKGFVGAKVIGSRNIVEFANAFRGLAPWDDWADPLYLDKLLVSPNVKPPVIYYKK